MKPKPSQSPAGEGPWDPLLQASGSTSTTTDWRQGVDWTGQTIWYPRSQSTGASGKRLWEGTGREERALE